MKQVLNALGMVFLAQLFFVGLVHLFLVVQQKHSPQTLESLHGLPVIGGFFLPGAGDEARELSAEEVREAEAEEALREGEEFFPLPEGFDREELTAMLRTLGETRQAQERRARELEEEREALVAATGALESQREEIMKFSEEIERRVQELEAKEAEVEARRNRIRSSEVDNLKTIAKIYENMSEPDVAAQKLAELDDDLIARILVQMPERSSGKILKAMATPRAVGVTREMLALEMQSQNPAATDR